MNNIDERIVEMRFDNKQFESGVKTTMKSIADLKTGLNFDGAAASLSNLERAGRLFSLSNMVDSIGAISDKFSAFSIIGITALQNLTNAAIDTGKKIVSALTIDPIKTGFNEYETKMGAIQTILTNTASKGTTLEDVNRTLNDLNEYSDKTIYNFAEMTRNIGTFTAAGVGLKDSAIAIKGIANLAAGSGSTSQQASTAMYQLSQALAAGSVKLMDWNSVVNAGMGGELFQNALKKTAKEMGIVIDESVSFRESLQDGWITSDVLIKTLSKFAEDEALVKAATEVKTFTQLFDTMKESVQSGWAISWENIIGNKEESTKMLTAINDAFGAIIGASADARNEMLAFWKANGGRAAIIEGVSNAFSGLKTVLKPIGEAFREVFTPLTGSKLVEISNNIKDLFSKFKIGSAASENLKNTFKGFFAAIDIGRIFLLEFIKALSKIATWLAPIGSGMLTIAGNLGNVISALRDAIKATDGVQSFANAVKNLFQPAANGVKTMLLAITDGLASLSTMDTSGLDAFSEKLKKAFAPITAIGEMFKNAFMTIAPFMSSAASVIGQAFGKLADKIGKEFEKMNFDTLISILNGALFMGVLTNIQNFVKKLTDITGGGASIVKNISSILDGVGKSLEAYQKNLQANTLITIASAIAILAASLIALSLVDADKLEQSLETLSVLFAEMFAASGMFGKILSGAKLANSIQTILTIQGLAVAVLILAKALDEIAVLDWNQIGKGIVTIGSMVAVMTIAAKSLGSSAAGLTSSAIGFIAFAAAIRILVVAVKELGELDIPTLTKGLVGVGVLITEVALFMKAANFGGMGVMNSVALIGLAVALNILAAAVGKFGDLNGPQIVKGLAAMGMVLAELSIFMKMASGATGIIPTAIGLTILGTAVLLFGQAISNIGSLPLETIVKGLGGMAGMLTAIAVAMKLMPGNIIVTAIGLTIVSAAILALSVSLAVMGSMSMIDIAKGLAALGGSLLILAGAMALMTTGLPGAAAMLVMSAALAVFVPTLLLLSSIPIKGVIVGLTALAGAFAVIGVAGLLLTPLVPSIIGLAAGIALLGVGMLATGSGLSLFATGIAILANNLGLFVTALGKAVKDIITIIPDILKIVGETFKAVAVVIGEAAPDIVKSLVVLINALMEAIRISAPKIIELFFKLIFDILGQLDKAIPEVVKKGTNLVIGLLKGISEKIPELVKIGADIIVNLLKGIAEGLPRIVSSAVSIITRFIETIGKQISKITDAGYSLMISFINGLAESIRKNTKPLVDAVWNLMGSIVEAGMTVLTGSIKGFIGVGKNIVLGLIEGIKSMITAVVDIVGDISGSIIETAKDVLGIHSPSEELTTVGQMSGKGLENGIKESGKGAIAAASQMAKGVIKASKDAFNKAVDQMDERKYYNKLSLADELEGWEGLQKKYKEGSEERKKADREVYRVKQELVKAEEEAERKAFDHSVSWIEEKKYYNQLSLAEELAAWERVQARYKEGSEERKKADREVYRVKQEIVTRQTQIDQEYYDNSKAINDQLKQDIQDLTREYESAVESRSEAIYNSYGLFDSVEEQQKVSGRELIQNLKDQVKAFEDWQKNITELAKKGIDEGLLKELTDMGPKAAGQIEALSNMSGSKLDTYVELWRQKHELAKTQATTELEGMKIETATKIDELNAEAQTKLDEYKTTWLTKMAEITTESKTQIGTMQTEVDAKVTTMRTETEKEFGTMGSNVKNSVSAMRRNTEKEFDKLTDNIQSIVKDVDWWSVGASIIEGITQGIRDKAKDLAEAAADAANDALEAAEEALDINSPSGEFRKLGMYADEGMAIGLRQYAKMVVASAKDVGNSAIFGLQNAIANISDVLNGGIDSAPVIRPVLDLSAVAAGAGTIGSILDRNRGSLIASVSTGIQNGRSNQGLFDDIKSMVRGEMERSKVDISGTLEVEVKNDRGEIIGIATTAVKDLLRRESR